MTERPESIFVSKKIGGEMDVVERVADVARSLGFEKMRVEDISTALREACVNAVEHGSPSVATYEVTFSYDLSQLSIIVSSKGRGISLESEAPKMVAKVEGSEKPRGWGLFLIQKLADSFRIESRNGTNMLHMTFARKRM